MLESHLNSIYIVENIQKDLNKIKSNSKQINTSLKSSNVLKTYRSLNFLKNTSDEDLSVFMKRKYNKFYKKSERKINLRLKKSSQKIKNLLIVFDSSMSAIKDLSDDPDIQNEAEKSLERVENSIALVNTHSKKNGLTTLGAALVIQQLLVSTIFVSGIFLANSSLKVVGSTLIAALGILVIYFVGAKKNRKKVIE